MSAFLLKKYTDKQQQISTLTAAAQGPSWKLHSADGVANSMWLANAHNNNNHTMPLAQNRQLACAYNTYLT